MSGFSRTTRDAPPALPGELTSFFWVFTLFTLGTATDAFLLLKRTNVAGSWSDRIGRRTVIGMGWLVYAAVYAGFATAGPLMPLVVWFNVYGV